MHKQHNLPKFNNNNTTVRAEMLNLSETSEENENQCNDQMDDAELFWQNVPTKRKHIDSPQRKQQIKINSSDQYPRSSNNKYAALEIDDEATENDQQIPKPPAIYIPNIDNINLMVNKLLTVIPSDDFNYKSVREGQIRLMVKTVDSYRKIIKYFESSNVNFHTYQLKHERSYRVVIKGLHHSVPTEDIKAELLLKGHQVRSVINARSSISKEPLSMFFVELDPSLNNKEIYDLKYLNHAAIKVEPPKKKSNDLVQCYRCQQFGHTKTYCKREYRCVKCGRDHPTSDCKKSLDSPPRCVHCSLNHTASYKGCEVYQNLISRRTNRMRLHSFNQDNTNFNINANEYPQLNGNSNKQTHKRNYNVSYAEVLGKSDVNSRIEKLEKMMENLMNMMTKIMDKLWK